MYPSHAASVSLPSLLYVPHPGSIARCFLDSLDVPNLKKRGSGTCSWIHVDAVRVGEEGGGDVTVPVGVDIIYRPITIFPILPMIFNDRSK
jgi:hypothetical protein